jgi:hypothetical protein
LPALAAVPLAFRVQRAQALQPEQRWRRLSLLRAVDDRLPGDLGQSLRRDRAAPVQDVAGMLTMPMRLYRGFSSHGSE